MAVFNNTRSFSTEIDFSAPEKWFMEQTQITQDITFRVKDIGKETNSSVYVRLVADGIHVPQFLDMTPRGDSEPYLNVAGKINIIEFFYDGIDVWYVIHNELNPVYTSYTDESAAIVRHSGTIEQNEVWVAGVIHMIEDDLVIPSGVTVTVEDGAIVVAPVLQGVTQITGA